MKETTRVLLLLTLAALFLSCSSDNPTDSSETVIWPLAVGNEWRGDLIFYQNGQADSIEQLDYVIISDTTIANEVWYGLGARTSDGIGAEATSFLANRHTGLWRMSMNPRTRTLSEPRLWLLYPARVGDEYEIDETIPTKVVSVSKKIRTRDGTFNCINYKYMLDQGYSYVYVAPGVGIVGAESNRFGTESDPPELGWRLTKVILK